MKHINYLRHKHVKREAEVERRASGVFHLETKQGLGLLAQIKIIYSSYFVPSTPIVALKISKLSTLNINSENLQ
jgi:hypothetical protein